MIKILNKKRYITEFCCIGHSTDDSAYIQFLFPNDFELPKGWKSNKYKTNIYYLYHTDDFKSEQDNVIQELTKWANGLKEKF